MKKVAVALVLMIAALVTVSACGSGGSAPHVTRAGCKAAALKWINTHDVETTPTPTTLPECKGLSPEVRASLESEVLTEWFTQQLGGK